MKDGLAIEVKHRKNASIPVSGAAEAGTETASVLELIWNCWINHCFGNFLSRPDNFAESLYDLHRQREHAIKWVRFYCWRNLGIKLWEHTHPHTHLPWEDMFGENVWRKMSPVWLNFFLLSVIFFTFFFFYIQKTIVRCNYIKSISICLGQPAVIICLCRSFATSIDFDHHLNSCCLQCRLLFVSKRIRKHYKYHVMSIPQSNQIGFIW